MKLFGKRHGYAVITNDSNVMEIVKKFAERYDDEPFIFNRNGFYTISFVTNEKRKWIRKEMKILFGRKYDMKFNLKGVGIFKKNEAK